MPWAVGWPALSLNLQGPESGAAVGVPRHGRATAGRCARTWRLAMSLPDRWPCVRTMSTASASRFPSDVNVAGTSANARGHVSDVSATLSCTAPGLSDILSGPAPHKAGVVAVVSVVGLLCPVNAWVVPDPSRE